MKIEAVASAILSKLEAVQDATDFQRVSIDREYVLLERHVTKRGRPKGRDLALLQAKTALYFCHVFADIHAKSPDEAVDGFRRHLEMARLGLQEYLGLAPLQAEAREREKWTRHWVSLYHNPGCTPKDRKSIIKTARSWYPDFDVSLFTAEAKTCPVPE
jgi:hypothetical protein